MRTEEAPIDQLEEMFYSEMMKAGEVCPLPNFTADIVDLEFETGVEFNAAEILTGWRKAGERMVDQYVSNEYESPDRTEDERADAVARWEAMRPSNVRAAAVAAMIANMDA